MISRRRLGLILFLVSTCWETPPLVAQHVVGVPHGDRVVPVRNARGTRPQIEVDGKLIDAPGDRLALVKVAEYRPQFVSVRKMEVSSRHIELVGEGRELNRTFHFRAEFESPYRLDDVFVVLDLRDEQGGRMLFLHEVGQLRARKPAPFSVALPLAYKLPAGKAKLHVFVGGAEVLHSEMPLAHREQALHSIVARHIKDITDAAPRPFVGPSPEYPSHLLKSNTRGKAVVTFKVSPRGLVLDPQVKEATDPAFGETALAAARQWRFIPRVKNSRPVETQVDMPFDFVPPSAASH